MIKPETFEGVAGNAPALRVLENALKTGNFPHAFLFYGPDGVGKRTVARRFGAVLVSGGDAKSEERALKSLHPDLFEVEPEGNFTTIGQVREVVRLAASRPFEGARRVFTLRADTLNVQAANALLKTLEEPEGESVFLLVAGSREEVLPTVLSRARLLRFNPVPATEVERFLEGQGVPDARLAALLGRGSVGLALRYGREEELKKLREAVFEAAFGIGKDADERFRAVEGITGRAEAVGSERESAYVERLEEPDRRAKDAAKRAGRAARDAAVREALELTSLFYRDAAVLRAGAAELMVNVDLETGIRESVEKNAEADWAGAALAVGEAGVDLTYNVSPEAILEVALSRARRKILAGSPGS